MMVRAMVPPKKSGSEPETRKKRKSGSDPMVREVVAHSVSLPDCAADGWSRTSRAARRLSSSSAGFPGLPARRWTRCSSTPRAASTPSRKAADPCASRLQGDETPHERIAFFPDEVHNRLSQSVAGRQREPQVEDADGGPRGGEDEPPEVSILRQYHAAFGVRACDDSIVLGARVGLRDVEHVMAGFAQRPHDCEVAAFVGHEPHQPPG